MAEIVKAVGLRGEVKLLPGGDFSEAVLASEFLLREEPSGRKPARVEKARWKGGTIVVKLAGLDGRNAAEQAVGQWLGFAVSDYDHPDFPRSDEPAPFLYHGLSVVTTQGEQLGTVEEVLTLPANMVLVVRGERGELLIPVIPPVVRELDREKGSLQIELIPGLLEAQE